MTPTFDTLLETHSAEIFAYLWRMLGGATGEAADAEDALQDTFVRAYRAYGRLDGRANHRAWLYKIATNVARTYWRRHKRRMDQARPLQDDLPDGGASVPDVAEQRELLAAIRQAVEALPYQQRAALILHNYQGLSYPAIAATLQCTEEAARANVYQALKKLRAQFAQETSQ